jgi:D-sedoheptulose 7-phosphate isomerase
MREVAGQKLSNLKLMFDKILTTDSGGKALPLDDGLDLAVQMILGNRCRQVMFIGNGASAAIASHMAADFWKNAGVRATAFNDLAMLTCVSNDCGYERVFAEPIGMFAQSGDLLMAISSSGNSENILQGVQAARDQGCSVISFSGFQATNVLRGLGDLNFYVPAQAYGPVEVLHHALCHCIVDSLCELKERTRDKAGQCHLQEISPGKPSKRSMADLV